MPAIPPTEAAVREAMRPPARPGGGARLAGVLAIGALFALIGSFLVGDGDGSKPTRPAPAQPMTNAGSILTIQHPEGFRMLVPLAPGSSGRRSELETMVAFSYLVRGEDAAEAERAIAENWNLAATRIGAVLQRCTRVDMVSRLAEINAEVIDVLDATLFGSGTAETDQVQWTRFEFR